MLVGFVGVLIGGLITYIVERCLQKKRNIRKHRASLIKLQFSLLHIINEITLLRRRYEGHKDNIKYGILAPIFGTGLEWTLDRELIFQLYNKGNKAEKELILDCSFFDRKFRGLIGSIEDKLKYYEIYKIDQYKMTGDPIPDLIEKHMVELTDALLRRLNEIDAESIFEKLKSYMEDTYPRLAIDYTVKN